MSDEIEDCTLTESQAQERVEAAVAAERKRCGQTSQVAEKLADALKIAVKYVNGSSVASGEARLQARSALAQYAALGGK